MQDYFCPRCGRRMPEGHCEYCENRQRRAAAPNGARPAAGKNTGVNASSGAGIPSTAGEKVIPFESIKGSENRSRSRVPGGRKQDIVLEFVDLGDSGGNISPESVREKASAKKRPAKAAKSRPGAKPTGGRISRWLAGRVEAFKRFADELINPEEE